MNFISKDEIAISLHLPSGEPWIVQSAKLSLIKQESQVVGCHLTGQIDRNIYESIDLEGIFHYDVNIIGGKSSGEFIPEFPINLTLLLSPEFLSLLKEQGGTDELLLAHLQCLSDEDPKNLLLSTDNWLLLSVQQQQPQGEVKYRTLWDYLDWSSISLDDSAQKADDLLLGAIANFSKDVITRQLATDPNYSNADPQLAQATTELIETLFTVAPSLFSQDEAAKEQCVNAIADVFTQSLRSQLTEYLEKAFVEDTVELSAQQLSESAIAFQPSSERTIFETVAHFFQTQDWAVNQISDRPILHFYFEGENGQWECYAQARETEGQFIFYSVLPLKAPQVKHQAVVEYITRANYGMIIGNFEFDFSDGEIRYKTSIDIDSSNLDIAVIGQLVYTNLLNVDKYLPGIIEVLDGEISPEEAIVIIDGLT